jgi:hypothetical protein
MESQIVENKININKITQITKKINIQIGLITCLILLLGIVAMSVGFFQEHLSSLDCNMLIFTGIILLIWAITWFLLKNKKYVYTQTGSTVKVHDYYIQREQMEPLKILLSHAAFSLAKPVHFQENGNVCLKVLMSDDKRFAAIQMFEYVSFSFQSATPVYTYTDVQASDFIAFLDKCKAATTNN